MSKYSYKKKIFLIFLLLNFFYKGLLVTKVNYGHLINQPYESNSISKNTSLIAWKNALFPWENIETKDTSEGNVILLNFINADIINVLKFFEEAFKVIFITDDVIQPVQHGGKSLYGSKINFTSNAPLSRQDAWNTLIALLEVAGVTLQPGSMSGVYRVVSLAKDSPANYIRGPLPTFVNVDSSHLPNTDMRVRYLYQVKNISLSAALNLIKTMQSPASPDPIEIKEMNGVLFVDRIFNIKTVLSVIGELDKLIAPEEMGIIRLKNASVKHVVDLYKNIIKEENVNQVVARTPGSKRKDMITYFDPQVKLIPDVRNNMIIALGSKDGIEKVRNFVENFQDIAPKTKYLPVHTYQLQYTEADAIANILKQSLGFKSGTDVGKYNGVQNGDKFLTDVFIVPETNTNSLLINCSEEHYAYIYKLLQKIDIEPKQVAVDIVIVSIDIEKIKQFGAQLRNSENQAVNWQTGLLSKNEGVVGNYAPSEAEGPRRLLGNLLNLVVGGGGANPPGTTVLSLGQGENGVWGIVKALMQEVNAKIINHPFIVVTDKSESHIGVGETRRIAATSITNANNEQQSYTSDEASLNIKMSTNISNDNHIFLNVDISNSIFTAPEGNQISAGNKTTRNINTAVSLNSNQMAAIGGLIVDHVSENILAVPWISKIPFIGAFFSKEDRQNRKSMLVIFIEPKILACDMDVERSAIMMSEKMVEIAEKGNKYKVKCPLRGAFFADMDDIILQYSEYKELTKEFSKRRGGKDIGNEEDFRSVSSSIKLNENNKITEKKSTKHKRNCGSRHKKYCSRNNKEN